MATIYNMNEKDVVTDVSPLRAFINTLQPCHSADDSEEIIRKFYFSETHHAHTDDMA